MRKVFQWIKDNPNRTMFLVPILLVAVISISHVVSWYDIANPINWAIYLSIAIEVGAMTALVAATNRIKGGVWFMFGLVTLIQMIGNIFFSFKEIDSNGELFKAWVELTSPLWEILGSDPGDIVSQKRWLAFLEGGLLPIISLTSLHFFTKYDRNKVNNISEVKEIFDIKEPDEDISSEKYEEIVQDFIRKQKEQEEKLKYTPTEKDFEKLNDFLSNINYNGPNKEEVNTDEIKFTPNEEELSKIEEVISNYSKPETILYSDESEDEENVINEESKNLVEEMKEPEIILGESPKSEIIEENNNIGQNKVLNYYKTK